MRLTKSKLILAAAFVGILGTTLHTASARADWDQVGNQWSNDKGDLLAMYHNKDTGKWLIWRSSADGSYNIFTILEDSPGGSNPNPDDPTEGKGTAKPDIAGLIKSGKATYTVRIAPGDSSELMNIVNAHGGITGLGPHYNPGDQDTGKGPGKAPTHTMTVNKTKKEIQQQIQALNEAARLLQSIEGSMGDVGEGGSENAPGVEPHDGKGKVDTTGNYSEGQNKLVGKTEKDLLGAKPDVINPPHLNKVGKSTTTIKHLTTADTNKSSGKTLSVTGAGLLDDGGGVGQNGPAGTGSSGGHVYRGIRDR